jgi:hypothetical protein
MAEDEVTVSQEEVAQVEREIAAKEAAQTADTEKAVEERVRTELKQEQELAAAKKELEAKEAKLQELEAAQVKAKAEADKLVQAEVARRVEEQVATTKAQRTAINPLNVQAPPQQFEVREADVKSIEQASYEAFCDANRINMK